MTRTHRGVLIGLVLVASLAVAATGAHAQGSVSQQPANLEAAIAVAAAQSSEASAPPAVLTYANRPIVEFRASVAGRLPADRAHGARQVLDRLVDSGVMGPVEARAIGPVMTVAVGGQDVFAILPSDIDMLSGATLATTASLAASRLSESLNEVAEARRPGQIAIGVLELIAATAAFAGFIWLLRRARAAAARRLGAAAVRGLEASKVGDAEFVRSSRIVEVLQQFVSGLMWIAALLVAYFWLTFALRRFPYTRYWGESLRGFLLGRLAAAGSAIISALPGLFTILVIVVLTRFVSRLVQLYFRALQERRINVSWIYPETAEPTRKLVAVGLWLFAVAISYPYLPGSDSEAFKGVSVFVGLMISLGSSGLVNQVMSGFTLIYSRALRAGDFVSVGDIEGTVTQLGALSTKIRTGRNEDVTIPNAVIVGQTVTNYSREADHGVFVPTDVTIGYDVAWRQVEALLLLAAARTDGVRREPKPMVRQAALQDAYVKYTLMFCPERPANRRATLAAVHANILDAFNEYGVQITSPNYEADPAAPKIVPRDKWFPEPARPDEQP